MGLSICCVALIRFSLLLTLLRKVALRINGKRAGFRIQVSGLPVPKKQQERRLEKKTTQTILEVWR